MKHLLLLATLFIGSMSFSQGMGDITVYSNTGDKFYVILNGIRQNDAPETNVKVTGLTNPHYQCKIMSANNNFTLDKTIYVKYDTLITYRIIEKKGKYKLRFFSEASLGTSTSVPDQTVVTYHATENVEPVTNNTTVVSEGNNVSTNVNTTGVNTTTTTTTTSTQNNVGKNTTVTSGDGKESVNMNVNITEGGMGMNIDVNATGTGIPDENVNVNTSSNSNTTTTTTTSTSNGNGTTYYEETITTTSNTNNGTTYTEETITTTSTTGGNNNTLYQDQDVVMTIDNNNSNCYTTDQEVDALVKQIQGEAFSDDQARIGNMAAKNKCMSSAQIKKVTESFTFGDNKVDFLKKAYDNCTDKANYHSAMDALTFSSDKEEVEAYINAK